MGATEQTRVDLAWRTIAQVNALAKEARAVELDTMAYLTRSSIPGTAKASS
jgi:hypothetical protein